MKVTVFKNIFDTSEPLHVDVLEILKRIKDGNSAETVAKVRAAKNKDDANEIKKRLPSICFSGIFSKRQSEYLLEHSGLICLDLDGVSSKQLIDVKTMICDDPFVFSCFVSPSGNGLKIIVKIHPDKSEHKGQFLALEHHFNEMLIPFGLTLDKSGKDVGRVCYESHDADLYWNDESEIFIETMDEQTDQKEIDDPDLVIGKLQKWIDNKETYFKGNRNSFLFRFASALCRYGIGQMTALEYLNNKYSDFPFGELKTTVKSAYKANNFGTEHFTSSELKSRITVIHGGSENEITSFWSINDRGRVIIDPKSFLNFISANGFALHRRTPADTNWNFVKVTNMIVDIVDVIDIKSHILAYVEKHAPEPVFAELQMRNRYFEKTFLNALPVLEIEQIRDDENAVFVFFDGFYYRIDADSITRHDYIDLNGRHIWRTQMSNRTVTEIVDFDNHDFAQFVYRATGQNAENFKNACSALGYMMHTYKKRRLTKLIYACDRSSGELDGMADGGTGKNLFFECLKFVRSVVDIDGKDFDKHDKFKFQTIQDDTQVVSLDDYEGNIKELFTKITGHFEIERKGMDKIIVPFDSAPKLMVSSNTAPSGFSSSYARRLHLIEFSDHYNEKNTPADEFGDRDFFSDDWTQHDWNCLFSFLFKCAQMYLSNGLSKQEISSTNKRKQLIKNTNVEFADFIETQKLDDWVNGRALYESYQKTSSENISNQQFYSFIRKYCAINNLKFETLGSGFTKSIKITSKTTENEKHETMD